MAIGGIGSTPQGIGYKEIVQDLQKELLKKGYTKEELKLAIDRIYNDWHLRINDFFGGTLPSDLGIDVIASDLLHEGIDDSLLRAIDTIRQTYVGPNPKGFSRLHKKANVKECYKDLLIYVLNHRERTHREIQVTPKVTQTQNFVIGKDTLTDAFDSEKVVTKEDLFKSGPALSSESDKGQRHLAIAKHNTNLASLAEYGNDHTKEKVILTRSGKSVSLARLQEAVAFACMEQLEAKNQIGFNKLNDDTWEFQHVLTSHLDASSLKAVSSRMMALIKLPEDELKFIEEILKANDSWPQEGFRLKVNVKEGDESLRPITIILKKPIVTNQIYSQCVRGVGSKSRRYFSLGQARSDRINFSANQELLMHYLAKKPAKSERFKEAQESLIKELHAYGVLDQVKGEPINFSSILQGKLYKQKDFFSSKAYKNYQLEVARLLYNRMKKEPDTTLGEQALFAVLFRQYPPENFATFSPAPKVQDEMHAADLSLYKNLLLDQSNLSHGVQCKSGTDRTGLAIALASAEAAFFKERAIHFIPDHMSKKDTLIFKKHFREAVKAFAVSVTIETRGFPGIKWGGGVPFFGGKGNPVPHKYLYLEEDLAPLKKYGIDDKTEPDVIKLTYNDLKDGIKQYRGKIRDERSLYGYASHKVVQETKKLQKSIPKATLEAAATEATTYLQKDLGIKEKALFNSDLHLEVHIRSLHLDKNNRELDLKKRVNQLKNKSTRDPKESLVLYMLDQVLALWERRKNEMVDK